MGQRRNKRRRSLRRRSARKDFARHYDQGGYQRSLFHELLEERRMLATDWLQLGADLDGEKAGDWAGNTTSLSADGMTLAIGAPKNDGLYSNQGADSGHIRIYRYDSTDQKWNPFGAEIDGEAAGDESGTSVSLSADGNIVAIGAPLNNGAGGTDSGHTRIYRYNPTNQQWTLFGAEIDGTAAGENFGTSVSMNAEGNIVAVGAPGVSAGHTRIYAYNSSGNRWDLLGKEIVGEASGDESGTAVSLSDAGNTVAIGAPKNSNVGSFSGHTRIYQYDSNASDWKKLGIDIDGENMIDMSGGAVALSGDGLTVGVGAILNTGNGSAAGHTRLYRYDAGAWKQLGSDIDAEKAGDASGASVSLSTDGNTVAIGAWGNDGANGADSGHVRVYRYNSSDNSWLAVGTDIDGEAAGDESGSSVSLSSDGNTIAIGAISNIGSGSVSAGASGHTRIYHFNDPSIHPFDLATLDGNNGFRLDGIDEGDNSGFSVNTAGDINGDGFDDILVGANRAGQGGDDRAGETYVIFGSGSGFAVSLDLATLDGSNGFRLDGIDENDYAGTSVSTAGDVNGDGYADILVGANRADPSGKETAGEIYLVYGKGSGFAASLDLSTLDGSNGFRIDGIDSGDYLGDSVSTAGDVNGDGFADILVGATRADPAGKHNAGEAYVVFGSDSGFAATVDIANLNGSNGFRLDGVDGADQAGNAVGTAGDVNGDGYDDILVGAFFGNHPGGAGRSGETYVVFGSDSAFPSSLDLSTLNGNNGFRLDGIRTGDETGYSVSGAGDINRDGYDDILVGARSAPAEGGGGNGGETYLILGSGSGFSASLDLLALNGTNGFRLVGIDAGDRSGSSVSRAGDINGDGYDDILVGAPNSESVDGTTKFVQVGESYVVFGSGSGFATSLNLSTLNGSNGFRLDGIDGGDNSGSSVSSAGDVNGDGYADILIGALGADSYTGETYVVFGGDFSLSTTHTGTTADDTLTGDGSANVMVAGQGDDILDGKGGADVLYGAEGDDVIRISDTVFARIDGGLGTDTLALDGSGLTLDLTAIADNKLRGIEQIDITGSGDNTLILNQLEVLNLSDTSNTLVITRDLGDTLETGSGWALNAYETIGDSLYEVFTQGAATLKSLILLDLGDAPAPYPTTLAEDGAWHMAIGPTLGTQRDTEPDGIHSAAATADDTTGSPDDEDGVTFGTIMVGKLDATATVNVQNAPRGAKLDAWIDFNSDGNWGGAGEQIAASAPMVIGDNTLQFDVPSWAQSGQTYARFRLSTPGGLGVNGSSADGEVEDYQLTIDPPLAASGLFGAQNIISTGADAAESVFAADVDGDGDMDILSASERDDKIVWYENKVGGGTGSFVAADYHAVGNLPKSVSVGDFNGDGNQDLAVADYKNDNVSILLGNGSGSFAAATNFTVGNGPYSVSVADFNGDGNPDLVTANVLGNTVSILLGNGNGSFAAAMNFVTDDSPSAYPLPFSVAVADFNGDGKQDVVTSNYTMNQSGMLSTVSILLGIGNGSLAAFTTFTVHYGARSVAVGDFNGDGNQDLVTANEVSSNVSILLGDGNGSFGAVTNFAAGDYPWSVSVADFNGDGNQDLAVANNIGPSIDDTVSILLGNGSGSFGAATTFAVGNGPQFVSVADFNDDGNQDLATVNTNDANVSILLGNGNGSFTAASNQTIPWPNPKPNSMAVADFNDDGTLDLAVVIGITYPNVRILLGEATTGRHFTPHTISTNADGARSVYAADVNGDGNTDILSASHIDNKISWYENNGNEKFIEHIVSTTAINARIVSVADVEGDGDIDILSASENDDMIAWYENDGNENFIKRIVTTKADGAQAVFAIDLDSDGDIDILSASFHDDRIAWHENDGNQNFTGHTISATANGAYGLFATDVDGDGDMDVLSASDQDDKVAWFENDGNQNFTERVVSTDEDGVRNILAADVNGDGNMDLLTAAENDDAIAWYENDGSQNFTRHTITNVTDGAQSVFAADMDGDGDLDVLSASFYDDKIAWYENNATPTLDDITNLAINEDAPEQTVNFVGAGPGGNESLAFRVTATSDNTALIPHPVVSHTLSAATGNIKFTPVPDQNGTATITVTVEDSGLDGDFDKTADNATFSRKFDILVNSVNDDPTLDTISDLAIDEDAPEQTVNFVGAGPGGNDSQAFRVTATSNNTALVPQPVVNHTLSVATGSLKFTPVPDQNGTATITVTVEDAGPDGDFNKTADNATFSRTFDVIVNAVNDPPTLDAISTLTIDEDASEQTVNLAGISAGGSESQPLRVTISSSNTDLIPDPTVTYASANATGNIAFTPVADQSGTATITVTVEDGGFDNDLDTSEGNATFSRSFDVIVNSINDDPTLEAVILEEIVQVGSDIDGEAAGDYSGSAVSISGDGTTVAIGAHENDGNDGNGDNSGHVRIFHLDETGWSQIGSDIDGEIISEHFGESVALNNDGTIVAIGTPSASYPIGTNLTGIGKVGVFQFNGTDWNQIGSNIYGEAKDDRSGAAISLSSDGKTLAIGAPLNGGNRGHVRIYRFDGSNWNQFGNDIDGKAANHLSGTSVSLGSNGLTVAIGSPTTGAGDFQGGATDLIGYARVYSYNSAGSSWNLVGSDINGLKWRDKTGQSVSLSADGKVVAVSSVGFTIGGFGEAAGQVRIFQLSSGNWQQIGDDINGLPGDRSGSSLSLTADGRTVAIGSPYHNHNGSNYTGTSRIYRLDGTQWNQVAENLVGESRSDYSGNAISISSDGSMVAVGAYLNDGSGGNAGHVRVHRIHDPNKVQENEYQEDADTQTINLYGISAGPNETQPLRVTASSSNASLIPNPTVTYTTPEATGTLQFTPVPDQYGSTTITVTVEDGGLDNDLDTSEGNATFSRSFDVIVNAVNDQPVITLTGDTNLLLDGLRGGTYVDPGYHCIDVEEGDITNKVILSGDSVDLEKLLTYVIRYDCQDSAGNPAVQKNRTVIVEDSLPPVTSLHLDNKVIQRSDNTQTGVGGESNTNPSDTPPTIDNEVGIANRLPEPIYRETGLKQPDGSDVRSRQDWIGRAAAAAAQTPGLPTTTGWDRLDSPVTIGPTILIVDLDGTSCQESCEVPQVDFSQRSTYLLKYDAQDKTDNYAEQIAFALVLDDQTAPVITVAGDAAELVELSSRWSLAESTAADNIDGNLTGNIRYRVQNETTDTLLGSDLTYAEAVNLLTTSTVANYLVTMTVSDAAGIYGNNNANNMTAAHKAIQVQHTVNALPTLDTIGYWQLDEDASEQTVSFSGVTSGLNENQPLKVTAISGNPDLFPNPTVTYTTPEATGTLQFTPVPDQYGSTTITVTVEDGGLDNDLDTSEGNATFSRSFDVTVTPVNDPPVLATLTAMTLTEGGRIHMTGTKLGDFVSDIDSDKSKIQYRITNLDEINSQLGISIGMDANSGQFVDRSDNSIHVHPATDFNGQATVTVEARDIEGDVSATQSFIVTVNPVNDDPIATNITFQPQENKRFDKGKATGLATLVTDIDEDNLTFSVVAGPSDGQLVLNEDGSFNYTPITDFNRTDSFTYRANDGTVDSNIGTVTLKIDTDYTWYNCREPRDVNADNLVTPLDVLWVINTINNRGSHPLAKIRTEGIVKPFLDVNRDAHATPLDALWVINYLNQRSFGEGEGASETPAAALAIDRLMSEQAMRRERLERANRAVTAVTGSVSQPVLDNTPYWQRVDETFDSIMRPARRSQLSDTAADRDELFEQSDWLDFLGEDEAL